MTLMSVANDDSMTLIKDNSRSSIVNGLLGRFTRGE